MRTVIASAMISYFCKVCDVPVKEGRHDVGYADREIGLILDANHRAEPEEYEELSDDDIVDSFSFEDVGVPIFPPAPSIESLKNKEARERLDQLWMDRLNSMMSDDYQPDTAA